MGSPIMHRIASCLMRPPYPDQEKSQDDTLLHGFQWSLPQEEPQIDGSEVPAPMGRRPPGMMFSAKETVRV